MFNINPSAGIFILTIVLLLLANAFGPYASSKSIPSSLSVKISPAPNWQISDFLGGQLVTAPLSHGRNTSMYITTVSSPNIDLPSFVESDISNLQSSTTGTVNIIEKNNTIVSNDFATVLRFVYRDSGFPTYTYEHQKTYLKHGDTIYVFDYAADNRESFSRYLEDIKNMLNSISFNSQGLTTDAETKVPPCPGGMGNSSYLDESTGQWVLECSS